MDDTDRPNLGDQVVEDITVEMHAQDEIYWAELHKLKVMRGVSGPVFNALVGPQRPTPPPPKRPVQLSTTLRRYADALFYIEASKYPPLHARFRHSDMRRRVAQSLQQMVRKFAREEQPQDSIPASPVAPIQPAKSSSTPQGQSTKEKRRAFVEPLLRDKGWSPLQWSLEAEVAYHTAADYLAGTTKPNRKSRARLARALEVSANLLPE